MKRVLLFWTLFFIGSYLSICQEISEEAKRHYDRGITALEMIENTKFANYTDAIKEFNKVKELAPKFKDVYLKLGQIYLKLKKYQEAAKNYKEYLPLENDAKKVSEIKTLINKLEYKAEKARELEPPTYNDVRIGDWVKLKFLCLSFGVNSLASGTNKTITCIDKDNYFVKLRIYEVQLDGKWEDDRYEIHSITEPVHLPILEFLKKGEETIIDSKKESSYYWVKTKANRENKESITEWWFSKAVPLAYLYSRKIRFKDDSYHIDYNLTDFGRGEEIANVTSIVKSQGSLSLDKHTFKPRQKIQVHFTSDKGFTSTAWIGIIPSHVYHGSEILNDSYKIAQKYLKNRATGTLTFKAPRQPGSYDLRMHNSDTTGKEVTYVTFQVE